MAIRHLRAIRSVLLEEGALTKTQIRNRTHYDYNMVLEALEFLQETGLIEKTHRDGKTYYHWKEEREGSYEPGEIYRKGQEELDRTSAKRREW